MANDLGDSHVNSLGQGGALPASSTNFRVVGKVYVESGKPVTYILYPEQSTKSLFIGLYNSAGGILSTKTGIGTLTGNYIPTTTGWITLKVKNSVSTNPSQRCWVNVTYTAPAIITNATAAAARNSASIWTGNGETSDWNEPKNWEEGMVPDETSDVVIPGSIFPQPALTEKTKIHSITIEPDARLFVNAPLEVAAELTNQGSIEGTGSIEHLQTGIITIPSSNQAELSVYPNPSSEGCSLRINGSIDANDLLKLSMYAADGKLLHEYSDHFEGVNTWLMEASEKLEQGFYYLRCDGPGVKSVLKFVKN